MYPDNDSPGQQQAPRSPRKRGRGRHFRPSRRKPVGTPTAGTRLEAPLETDSPSEPDYQPEVPPEPIERETSLDEPARPERREGRESRERIERGPAISRAVEHVQQIINDLKSTVDEMELVLELLEEAERQKIDDERELKALQKGLERVNRFRGGHRSSGSPE